MAESSFWEKILGGATTLGRSSGEDFGVRQAIPITQNKLAGLGGLSNVQQPTFNYPTEFEQPYQESDRISNLRMQDLMGMQEQAQREYETGLGGGGWGSTGLAMTGKRKLKGLGHQKMSLIESMATGEKNKAMAWSKYVKEYKTTLKAELKSLYEEYDRAKISPTPIDDEQALIKIEELIARANMDLGGDKTKDVYGLGASVKRFREGRKSEETFRKSTEKKPIPITHLVSALKSMTDWRGQVIKGRETDAQKITQEIMNRIAEGETSSTTPEPSVDLPNTDSLDNLSIEKLTELFQQMK